MKPKLIHQEAMNYSFKAKQALEEGNHLAAFDLYVQAANLESQVAEFYFDKPELEPTRSVLIRSAAFLNLKAGLVEEAKKFIFFGLLNTQDTLIKLQLNNALELAVSLNNVSAEAANRGYYYISLLRQRSVHYILEPPLGVPEKSMSLEVIKDFSDDYLKSLRAFAKAKLKKLISFQDNLKDVIGKEIDKFINPLVTSSAYGSFKFSIANNYLSTDGETDELLKLKANIVLKYHNEIFTNPLADIDIEAIRREYEGEDVNAIFRPLAKIKATNAPYRVGYYDSEDFTKRYATKIINSQRKKLIISKPVTPEEIGELESSITHKVNLNDGKTHTTTLFREKLNAYEFDLKTNQIEPSGYSPLILTEDILLYVAFASHKGFTISFEDLDVEYSGIAYGKTLQGFYNALYQKVKQLANNTERDEIDRDNWQVIKKLIGNPEALFKSIEYS